jgi:uncharacterized membrane protein YraQ (UPF0718 family)/copper chaperone CopZ
MQKFYKMERYITPLIDLLNEMTPYLLLGFLVAGILKEFVPRRIYADKLSGNNFRSVLWAALLGIPLPLCSCGVIPTAASLRREGASRGATVSFLISTPQTGVDSILATASVLGIPFAICRPLVALITALAGGSAVNIWANDAENGCSTTCSAQKNEKSFMRKCIDTLRYGFIDMLQDIGKWIVIGLIIAAIITIAVPEDFFTGLSKYPLLNMLVILLFSAPMYLCATGSIPIAAALMLKGLSPGAALVLLVAGPATNMAAMLVINKILGRRTLLIYLLSIIVGAVAFGLAIDYLLPNEWFNAAVNNAYCSHCHVDGTPWWQTASSIIFVILLIAAFILRFKKGKSGSMQKSFRINGMMCNHCKANVEKALANIKGVTAVRVELAEGRAFIDGENFSAKEIIDTIRELGYEYIEE